MNDVNDNTIEIDTLAEAPDVEIEVVVEDYTDHLIQFQYIDTLRHFANMHMALFVEAEHPDCTNYNKAMAYRKQIRDLLGE